MDRPIPRNVRGFTLVELVMVIVILAVLAMLVLPRVLDLGRQARVGSVNALAAAVKGAADNVYAACQMGIAGCDVKSSYMGSRLNGPTTVQVLTLYGWPRGGDYGSIHQQVQSTDFTLSYANSGWYKTWWAVDGSPTPAQCGVLYEDPVNRGPDLGYLVTVDTSGC